MGKKRKFDNGGKKILSRSSEVTDTFTSSLFDPTSREFVYDEVDDFEDQGDNLALSRAKEMMAPKGRSREQVLALDIGSEDDGDDDDDDSDEDEMYMEDDIVDQYVERAPDDRAWGQNKRRYIGTDTTDERIHKRSREGDEELQQLEEEAARKLQERLAAELDYLPADDLILEEEEGEAEEDSKVESALEVNLSALSKSKKLQLLKRESPEFLPLMEDLKEKCEELRSLLCPLMEGVKGGHVVSQAACEYISTKYRLVLNYVCTVNVYMLTKASHGSVRNHPVLGRLAQYRQLLQELTPCDEQLVPHLQKLLPKIKEAVKNASKKAALNKKTSRPSKKLHILRKKGDTEPMSASRKSKMSELLVDSDDSSEDEERRERLKNIVVQEQDVVDSEEENQVGEQAILDSLDPDSRRKITYQISKNKGLVPSRKKEQRNPRVKYRRKYTDKLKKRKGQVREVRRELKRYEGEVSGIKSHTIKSVKIK